MSGYLPISQSSEVSNLGIVFSVTKINIVFLSVIVYVYYNLHFMQITTFDSSAVDLLTPSTLVSLEQAFSQYGSQKQECMSNEAFTSTAPYIHTILPVTAGPVMAIKQEYNEEFSSEDSDASSSWTMSPATMQGRVSDADSSTSLNFGSNVNNSAGPKGRGSRSRNRANDPYVRKMATKLKMFTSTSKTLYMFMNVKFF
jgi:hypothetical protein